MIPTGTERFHQAFFDEVAEHLETLETLLLALDRRSPAPDDLDALFRAAHSIKGGSATFGFPAMASFTHVVESALDALRTGEADAAALTGALLAATDVLADQLAAFRAGRESDPETARAAAARLESLIGAPPVPAAPGAPADDFGFFDDDDDRAAAPAPRAERRIAERRGGAADSTIRVDLRKVDHLINLVGEMVISHAKLARAMSALDPVAFDELHRALRDVERNSRDIQENVMSVRMVPIGSVFGRFPRMLRDLASRLGKDVSLVTIGGDTELDKNVIEQIADPLVHLVRNCVDHGIEPPDQRVAAGKPAAGSIVLRSSHVGGDVLLEVIDDGAGLDRERIVAKARAQGIEVADTATDEQVWRLIFAAGFSTAAEVTDISGRGVGMDVVRRNVASMGGRVDVTSARGAGTHVSIRLPLTLAILDGLSVSAGSETFIIPMTNILESVQPLAGDVHELAANRRVVAVRGEYVPVVVLTEIFNLDRGARDGPGIFVLLEAANGRVALHVDALEGQHQVVIKSLEANFRKVEGISAATVMGDGRVALILDTAALVRAA